MAISRHLILPAPINTKENNVPQKQDAGHEDENFDEGTTPSFCVLLHGALKIEDMAALVTLSDNWYVYNFFYYKPYITFRILKQHCHVSF